MLIIAIRCNMLYVEQFSARKRGIACETSFSELFHVEQFGRADPFRPGSRVRSTLFHVEQFGNDIEMCATEYSINLPEYQEYSSQEDFKTG
jgi:hypothetical protein